MNIEIVDPQLLAAQGLKCILKGHKDVNEIKIHSSLNLFIQDLSELNMPDILLIDMVDLDIESKNTLIKIIEKTKSKIKIILFTRIENLSKIKNIFINGASGLLSKYSTTAEELQKAISEVNIGNRYIGESLRGKILEMLFLKKETDSSFGNKELEVLTSICKGIYISTIADKMGISEHTVQYYIRKLMAKAKVKKTSDLILYALNEGIFTPEIHLAS